MTTATERAILFDVDGTLLDVLDNQRRVWAEWARRYSLDIDTVYATAVVTRPTETFALVAPDRDPAACLAVLHELEDADARAGTYAAFSGAANLLARLPRDSWGIVTGNYAHRVGIRFERLGLPLPPVLIDAAVVTRGKPDPEGYLTAAAALGREPGQCLVVEDSTTGIRAGLAAGMTVWAVNSHAPDAMDAHRSYAHLELAQDDIISWVRGMS